MKWLLLCAALVIAPITSLAGPPPLPIDVFEIEAPIVLAQAAPPTAETPTPPPAAPEATPAEGEANVGELVTDAGKVIDDWQNLGWLAGVIALINLLLGVLRFRPINDWLVSLDYKWLKPLIATVLGAALGGFSTFETGAGILNSIVAGAVAGLSSVGFHELIDKTRKRTTKPSPAKA